MDKEFISYEIALKLKELGFDEPCLGFYDGKGDTKVYFNNKRDASGDFIPFVKNERLTWFGVPTYSQAFKWFREKHGLYVSINIHADNMWSVVVKSMTSNSTHTSGYVVDLINKGYSTFKTYEEAESACLEKLIEIIEQRNAEMTAHGVYR